MIPIRFSLIVICFASFSNLFSQDIPYPLERLEYDSSIVQQIIETKFKLTYKVKKVDTVIKSFILSRESSNCVADPKEPFNDSDLKSMFLCDLRLLFYGKSIEKDCSFLVYQEGTMGGIAVNGYLFKLRNDKILGVAKVDLAHNLKKYKDFIKLLKSEEFSYTSQYRNFHRSSQK